MTPPADKEARLTRIVSGGQTGADRGGLEAAIGLGIAHGGWCPRGRLAEDGEIPARYRLRETAEASYAVRTRKNVEDSDGTVLFTYGRAQGGSQLTTEVAAEIGKPLLHVDLAAAGDDPGAASTTLRRWLVANHIRTLNVAGARESEAPGIEERVRRCLEEAFAAAFSLRIS